MMHESLRAPLRSALREPGTVEQIRERLVAAHAAFDHRTLFELIDELKDAKRWSALGALCWYASERTGNVERRDVLMFHAGESARMAGELELARDLMSRVIQRSTVAGCHSLYALVLLRLSELDAALDAAKRSVELDPAFDEGWFRVGEVCKARLAWDDAVAAFDKARRLDPAVERYAVEYAGAVIAVEVSGAQHPAFEAVEALLEPIAARGDDFWAMIYWAQLEWVLDNTAESERALRSAMMVDPESVLPYTLLALYLESWARPPNEFDALVAEIRARADEFAERDPVVAEDFRSALRVVEERRNRGAPPLA